VEPRKNRISVGGLRKADSNTLLVLTQDVLRRPLGQIERGTLCDLLALSEIPDQVGKQLSKELDYFRDQMKREISDLPDGPAFAELASDLMKVDAGRAPTALRSHVAARSEDLRSEEATGAAEALLAHWEDTDPDVVNLPLPAAALPKSKETGAGTPRKQVIKAKEPARKRVTTTVDSRREEWIREDAVDRLKNYGSRGLKEAIMVAGSRHRAPWDDVTDAEVLTILRKMKREGRLRFSAGRWMIGS
jgi:hypothetical protein